MSSYTTLLAYKDLSISSYLTQTCKNALFLREYTSFDALFLRSLGMLELLHLWSLEAVEDNVMISSHGLFTRAPIWKRDLTEFYGHSSSLIFTPPPLSEDGVPIMRPLLRASGVVMCL